MKGRQENKSGNNISGRTGRNMSRKCVCVCGMVTQGRRYATQYEVLRALMSSTAVAT